VMKSARQNRCWQGRRPKDSTSEFEAEDADQRRSGRRFRGGTG
jgi:hypothetical protein